MTNYTASTCLHSGKTMPFHSQVYVILQIHGHSVTCAAYDVCVRYRNRNKTRHNSVAVFPALNRGRPSLFFSAPQFLILCLKSFCINLSNLLSTSWFYISYNYSLFWLCFLSWRGVAQMRCFASSCLLSTPVRCTNAAIENPA